MNKSKLIKLCIKGDKKAWRIFLNKYSRLVYWAIHKRLASSQYRYSETDTQDIFQEVFLTLLKDNKLKELTNIEFLPGWLSMITANKTTDYIRKEKSRREELVVDFPTLGDTSFQDNLAKNDTLSVIRSIIDNLKPSEKIIISLNLLQGKPHKDIAQITNMPINTISTIIARTKEKIKNNLKKMKEI